MKILHLLKSSTHSLTTSSTHMQKQVKNLCMDLLWEHFNSSIQGKSKSHSQASPISFNLQFNMEAEELLLYMPIILNTNQEQKPNKIDRNFPPNCFLYPRVVKPETSGSCSHANEPGFTDSWVSGAVTVLLTRVSLGVDAPVEIAL